MAKNMFGNTSAKVNWEGKIVSIQPRTRVWRYLTDNRTHYHLGYNLFIEGCSSEEKKQFADYYRAGSFKVLSRAENLEIITPPWIMMPPIMEAYEKRGTRLLSKSLWETKCFKCIWTNMANVEIQWDFDKDIKKYRFEAFCYGPKSCKFYKMGRARSVPYKNRGSAIDNGYLDELCIEGRDEED